MGGFSKLGGYRLDRDALVGGVLLYVREDIPSNLLEVETKPIFMYRFLCRDKSA